MSCFQKEEIDNILHITFDTPDSKANIFTEQALSEFRELLLEIKNSDVECILFKSAKKGIFIAGADISEINSINNKEDGIKKASAGQEIMNLVEDLKPPTVALINGACVGGGLEFALACDYRIATFSKAVRIGLPETKLGIIPGFGGTVRLPKVAGLLKSLNLILKGTLLDADRAFKSNLVDYLAPDALLVKEAIRIIRSKVKRPARLNLIERLSKTNPFVKKFLLNRTIASIRSAQGNNYPHLFHAADSVISCWGKPREAALKIEADRFGNAIRTQVYKSLIHVFHMSEKYKKKKWSQEEPSEVSSVAVLGAGVMGGGIAQLFAAKGYRVSLKDIHHDAIRTGLSSAKKVFDGAVTKKRLSKAEAETALSRIRPTLSYSGLQHSDLIIEAVVEDMKIKQSVLAEVSKACRNDAVLATNTSSLSIEALSADLPEHHKLVGMHFFNPVHLMPLVEVIKYSGTSDAAVETVVDISRKLGKTPVVVKNGEGFLVNRILMPFLNEAGYLFSEGVDYVRIDHILKEFGMPMSAFRLLDEIGIDVAKKVAGILEGAFGSRMKTSPAFNPLYEKGMLGRKTGKGFFIYKGRDTSPNPEIVKLTGSNTSLSDEDILDRCILQMVNEACYCLEDKICEEASDIDISMIMGTGFPPFRGGLLKYAESRGLPQVLERLMHFEKTVSQDRFRPSPLLNRLVEKNQSFYSTS